MLDEWLSYRFVLGAVRIFLVSRFSCNYVEVTNAFLSHDRSVHQLGNTGLWVGGGILLWFGSLCESVYFRVSQLVKFS